MLLLSKSMYACMETILYFGTHLSPWTLLLPLRELRPEFQIMPNVIFEPLLHVGLHVLNRYGSTESVRKTTSKKTTETARAREALRGPCLFESRFPRDFTGTYRYVPVQNGKVSSN